MSNWKKYGGINNLDNNNNVSVYSFVADIFTLRQAYYGTFDICGELHVSGNTIIDSNLKANNTTVVNDISTNRLFVNDIFINSGNVFLLSNLDVSGNINLDQHLFLGNSKNAYLFGTSTIGNIGINTRTPIAALDISSSRPLAFNVGTAVQENIYAVPLQNKNNRGIVMNVNTNSSQINFYNDASINYQSINPDGKIQYMNGGNLIIDVSNNTSIFSNLSVSNRAEYSHVMGETAVIYDISAGTYLKLVYENSSENTGNGASIIANDSSSNTFMNMVTPSGQGLSIGGGVYPNDQTRAMGSIGWRDISMNYVPSINIVSGNSRVRNKSTVGINTYGPITEIYGVDINGSIHVKNGELTITNQSNFEITSLTICKTFKNCAIALGSPYTFSTSSNIYKQQIIYTSNSGETWSSNFDLSGGFIESFPNVYMRSSFIYDLSLSIIVGDYGFAFYSFNGFASNWKSISVSIIPPGDNNLYKIKSVYINPSKRAFFGIDINGSNSIIYWFNLPSNIYTDENGFISGQGTQQGMYSLSFAGINSMDGCGNSIWVVGNKYIEKFSEINASIPLTTTYANTLNFTYNSIYVLDPNNIIAAGSNIISYSINSGTTWTDFSLNGIVNSIGLFDTSNAIAVCNSGKIFTSSNWKSGSYSWTQISNEALNVSGNANRLNDASYNLTNIGILNTNNFYITKTISKYIINSVLGNTSLFHVYLPNVFNNITNYVFDVSGSSRISGDMNVNDEGKIASNNQLFYLLNNGVNQVYFGGDASYIYAGSLKNSTFVTKYDLNVLHDSSLNGNIVVGGNALVERKLGVLLDTSLNANLFVAMDSSFNGNLVVGGNTLVERKLGVLLDTSMNANLFVALDSSLNGNMVVGGNTVINRKLGVLQDTSLNANLFVASDSSLNGNLVVGGNTLVERKLGVLQDTSLNANLFVALDSSLNGNMIIGGNTVINRKLGVLHDTSLNANLFVALDSSLNGNMVVGGNIIVNRRLGVLQDTSLNANLFVALDSSLNGNMVVGGNTVINRKLGVLQDTSLNAKLFVASDSSFNGNLVVGNNLLINKNVSVQIDLSANGNIYGNQIVRTNFFECLGGTTTGGPGSISTSQYDINIGAFNLSGISGRNIKIGNFNNSINTKNSIYLGGTQDQIIIQGEIIQTQNVKAGPILYLNYLAGPSSSVGSGVRIGDDGTLDNGYISISSDRKGYILKATEPNKRNVIKFDIFNMTLANTQPSGLISITPSPAGFDSSFTLASSPIDPSNIILGNKTLSSATQQVIDISLSIIGLMSIGTMSINPNYALTVSGSIYQPNGLVWQF